MTTELAARLRELAEKATRGPWRADTEGKPDDDMNHGIVADVNDLWIAACYRSGTTADCERSSEAESEVAANAAYIAATNPQTILALLDEIDSLRATIQSFEDGSEKMALKGIKMRREIDRLRQRKDELQQDLQTTADALGHADKEIETLRGAMAADDERLAALETRISELEAARIAYANEFPFNAAGEPDVGNIHANIRAMKAAAARVPDGYIAVKTETLLWLLGERGEFVCPEHQYFRGKPTPYFWRSVLRDAMLTWPPLREQECLHSTTHQWYLPTSNATGQSARSNYCKTPACHGHPRAALAARSCAGKSTTSAPAG